MTFRTVPSFSNNQNEWRENVKKTLVQLAPVFCHLYESNLIYFNEGIFFGWHRKYAPQLCAAHITLGSLIETKMQRYNDIQELLSEISTNIEKLKSSYASASKDENIKAVSRPLVKSCLEHLRSSLEYCAQDIYERKIGGSKSPYFPYGENFKKFQSSVSNNLPGVDKLAPSIYKLILDIQPFSCGDSWLIAPCNHTNFNKLNSLSKHDRINSPTNTTNVGRIAKIGGGANIVMSDCYVNGVPIGHSKPLVLNTQRPVKEMQAELPGFVTVTREFDWVEFRFPGTAVDALQLVNKSHANITNFVSLLNSSLP